MVLVRHVDFPSAFGGEACCGGMFRTLQCLFTCQKVGSPSRKLHNLSDRNHFQTQCDTSSSRHKPEFLLKVLLDGMCACSRVHFTRQRDRLQTGWELMTERQTHTHTHTHSSLQPVFSPGIDSSLSIAFCSGAENDHFGEERGQKQQR